MIGPFSGVEGFADGVVEQQHEVEAGDFDGADDGLLESTAMRSGFRRAAPYAWTARRATRPAESSDGGSRRRTVAAAALTDRRIASAGGFVRADRVVRALPHEHRNPVGRSGDTDFGTAGVDRSGGGIGPGGTARQVDRPGGDARGQDRGDQQVRPEQELVFDGPGDAVVREVDEERAHRRDAVFVGDPHPELRARLERLQRQAADATTALRESFRTLRSSPAALALGVALRADCAAFADRTGLPAELAILDDDPPELPPSRADVLLTAVREALLNVEKHAHASSVTVSVRRSAPWLTIAVHDDGVGLGPDHAPGLGLTSTAQALGRLGGSVRVVSDPDGGTIWRARLPC